MARWRQEKRNKPKLDFLKTRHFQEKSFVIQVGFMHARVNSVSFLCVSLNHKGSREPQKVK